MLPDHSKLRSLTNTPSLVDSAELSRHEPVAHTEPPHSSTLTSVEPEDLARFEGEGGLGEPAAPAG